MRKYLIAYIIGFILLIGGSVNLAFELVEYEYEATPLPSELTTKEIDYDVSEIWDEDGFSSFHDYEIDDSLEDNIVRIKVSGIGELNIEIRKYNKRFYEDERHYYVPSFYIGSKSFNLSKGFDSLIKQIESKKIYEDDYQFNNFHVTFKMNSKTAEKYVD